MYIYLSNQDHKVSLDYTIDNSCGLLKVALHEIYFRVTWFNISEKEENNWMERQTPEGQMIKVKTIPDGYYGFCDIKKQLKDFGIVAKLNDANLKVTLTFKEPDNYSFIDKLAILLGFTPNNSGILYVFRVTEKNQSFEGDSPLNLSRNTLLHVRLHELNTNKNLYDGKPTTILRVLESDAAGYCKYIIKTFTNLQFKKLSTGHFDSLTLSITDENGKKVPCDDLLVTLEIQ